MDVIDLNEKEIDNALISLKSTRRRLAIAIEKQENLFKKLFICWGGTSGEKVQETLKKHAKRYEEYIKNLDNNIKYLESVRNAYRIADEGLSKKIDSNYEERA